MDPAHASGKRRVLFVQYYDPLAYPPIVNAIHLLARDGWAVRVIGTRLMGLDTARPPVIEGVAWRLASASRPGLIQKIHYAGLALRALLSALAWRPAVAYVSDPIAAPIGWLIRAVARIPVLYHEHDAPEPGPRRGAASVYMAARARLARSALACVVPNEQRAGLFRDELAIPADRMVVAWNCPRREEAASSPAEATGAPALYYHGSINRLRLPETLVEALSRLPRAVRLVVVGNETVGSRGYMESFLQKARDAGVAERIDWRGYIPRAQLLSGGMARGIGLALMPAGSDDINMRHMAGASNKAFEYLAMGFPVLVTRQPDWIRMFVGPGYGAACDPSDASSIAEAVEGIVASEGRLREMGELGRRRILDEWNYERQFEPVRKLLDATPV